MPPQEIAIRTETSCSEIRWSLIILSFTESISTVAQLLMPTRSVFQKSGQFNLKAVLLRFVACKYSAHSLKLPLEV